MTLYADMHHYQTVITCAQHKERGTIHILLAECFTKIAKYYSSFQYLVQRYLIICIPTCFNKNLYEHSYVTVLYNYVVEAVLCSSLI